MAPVDETNGRQPTDIRFGVVKERDQAGNGGGVGSLRQSFGSLPAQTNLGTFQQRQQRWYRRFTDCDQRLPSPLAFASVWVSQLRYQFL